MSMNYGKTSYSLIKITTQIEVSKVSLFADVNIPAPPKGIIIMAVTSNQEHKNIALINELVKNQYGVVVVKLFTNQELVQGTDLQNLDLISYRFVEVTKWVKRVFAEGDVHVGLWGFGKGAAAALKASLELKDFIKAVICREVRYDLIEEIIEEVTSPTLLIADELNKELVKLKKLAEEKNEVFDRLITIANDLLSGNKISSAEAKESADWISKNIDKEIYALDTHF